MGTNSSFTSENLTMLGGLVQNGTVDGMPANEVKKKWAQFFGGINDSTFRSRLASVRKKHNKPGTRGTRGKAKCEFIFFDVAFFSY